MKTKLLSKFIIGMSALGIGLIALPTLASCSSIDDLKIVDRGDGKNYASYGDNFKVSFEEEIGNALIDENSYSAFKKQYANQLLYNFYKKIVDSGKLQSFKDDWDKWNKDIDKDYDDKVQELKDKHGSNWEFYLQNEVLDPSGGTTEAWKYNQLCSKIREDFKSKVFANNYLAYSSSSDYKVNNDISTFQQEDFFEHPENWRQINFYAKNKTGGNYNKDRDLDDVYALVQKTAFEKYTGTNHPFSVSMCLWKYQAPTTSRGVLDVYSDKINKGSTSQKVNDESINPSYEFPTFPEFRAEPSANGKFWRVINDLFLNNGSSYGLTSTGFSNIPNDKLYTDDSATQFIVQSSDLSSVDAMFGGAAVNLWANYSGNAGTGKFVLDKILKYDINDLLTDKNIEKSTDILRNFFFRSNDSRLFKTDGSLTDLGTNLAACENKIDLNNLYESKGTAGKLENNGGNADFHSKIFRSQSPLFFDYYGDTNPEGGVQWVVSALRLYDGTKPLPYILVRDEMSQGGVHIIGLNGAIKSDLVSDGYLAEPKNNTNDNTEPFSQGRENILLKAQYLWEKAKSSTTIGLESKIEDFFNQDVNMNDIIISMAKNGVIRVDQTKIFDDEGMFNVVGREDFYDLISFGNDFFATQSTISAIDSENKKLFNTKFTNVKNSITSRSDSWSQITKENYQNGMSTPYPFAFSEPDNNSSTGYVSSLASFDINGIIAREKSHIYDTIDKLATDVWDKNEITFDEVKQLKNNYIIKITNIIENKNNGITPYIQDSGTGKYSEHIYNKWDKDNPLSVAVYAALESFGGSDSFSNNVKIKAMRNYINSCFGEDRIVNGFDSFNGYALFKDDTLKNAFASYYETNQLINSDKPLSMYQYFGSVPSISSYVGLIDRIFQTNLNRSYSDIEYSSSIYDYLLVLDALQYLVKDNYKSLIDYLQNNVVHYGDDANLVWISEENTDCNPEFNVDKATINDEVIGRFGFQKNYYGQYSNTYFNNSGSDDKPNSFTTNDAYYKCAPMPTNKGTATTTEWVDAMGYVGLVTPSNTTSPITSTISDQIFKNAYYTKRIGTGQNDRKGGWYKYISWEKLLENINRCSGIKDITDLVNNLANDLTESDFANHVKDIVSHSFYEESDPEVINGLAKTGDPVSLAVLKDRVIGDKDMYQNVSWGLTTYKINHTDLVNSMFQPFGNKDSVAEVCDGNDTQNIKHTIKTVTDEETYNQARVMVLQLNNTDVSSYDNLFAALGGTNHPDQAKTLINLIAVQYATDSSIKNLALQDVIQKNFDGNKLTVYDRRFNDKLGRVWVKDWKASN